MSSAASRSTGSRLFASISLRGLTLDNRIVYSPMGQYMADPQGAATDWHAVHLGMMSLSGAGLIFTEATAAEPRGRDAPTSLGLWTDAHEAALKNAIDICKRYAPAKHAIQLWHSGRKGSMATPFETWRQLAIEDGGWALVSPSNRKFPGRDNPLVTPDADELASIAENFARSAERAARIGYDLLELHCAHGYLLHSFLSPLSNHRTDRYGGDLNNRMRFPLEAFAAVRRAWPEDRPMGVRISATDWVDGGWSLEDSLVFAARLKEMGCDYITPSSGGSDPGQAIVMGPGYQIEFAAAIRKIVGIPTMAVGMITEPALAEHVVASGEADMVALGRGLLNDPRWPWRAAEILGGEIAHPPQYMRGDRQVWRYSSALKK